MFIVIDKLQEQNSVNAIHNPYNIDIFCLLDPDQTSLSCIIIGLSFLAVLAKGMTRFRKPGFMFDGRSMKRFVRKEFGHPLEERQQLTPIWLRFHVLNCHYICSSSGRIKVTQCLSCNTV